MHKFTKALAAIGLAAVMSQSAMAENLKLGFLVKQPEEPWFQTEWKFADKAGKDLGFEVIGSDSNLLIVFYVQIMPDDLVMQLHR
ncbi:hypothetical protein QU967_15805, partial [Escherichia coli]|nr:hypothetical protein [Escherichia coli]